MTDSTLKAFREIANQIIGKADWEWVGQHMSQGMFGITQERAECYARSHGGTARQMVREGFASAQDEQDWLSGKNGKSDRGISGFQK